jgi:hypothetical protein
MIYLYHNKLQSLRKQKLDAGGKMPIYTARAEHGSQESSGI